MIVKMDLEMKENARYHLAYLTSVSLSVDLHTNIMFKGITHLKMNNLSLFTQPHVAPRTTKY